MRADLELWGEVGLVMDRSRHRLSQPPRDIDPGGVRECVTPDCIGKAYGAILRATLAAGCFRVFRDGFACPGIKQLQAINRTDQEPVRKTFPTTIKCNGLGKWNEYLEE